MYKWLCIQVFSAYLGKCQGIWFLDCMVTEFCLENAPVIANTLFQQHRKWLYTWTSPNGQYWNQIDYILCRQRWKSCTQSAKTRAGADCGSDHQLLIEKFRLKLKKVGKTTRPARYHLYPLWTCSRGDRLKGLDLVNSVPEELWMDVCNIIWEAVNKTILKKKKSKKAKCLFEETLEIAEERSEKQGRKGKVHPTKCRVPENRRWDKTAFFKEQCIKLEGNNRRGKTR